MTAQFAPVSICIFAFILAFAASPVVGDSRDGIGIETFGAEANPTGNPIGGGKGYTRLVTQGKYQVKSLKDLLDALKKAKTGEVVYVDDDIEIDMTGQQKVVIHGGVTLASGRGKGDSQGALLYSNELKTAPLFQTGGGKVRITGLRLRGPDTERRTEEMRKLFNEGKYYSLPNSRGIYSSHANLEIDNCEIWGWSHAAVHLGRGTQKAYIHHNYIHHNQRSGLGYGICLDRSDALIEANLFDWCRHHIAGTGKQGTAYEARYNLIMENANSHSFDMHGQPGHMGPAGAWIKIHHNTFKAKDVPAVKIRGVPDQGAEVHHNWFIHDSVRYAVRQGYYNGGFHDVDKFAKLSVYKNLFTADRITED